jgi:hypothetical protein
MLSSVDLKILNFFDSYNVDRIVNYHNEIKRLFQNEISYINKKLDDESISDSIKKDLLARKNRYLNDYHPQMIITNFLMMFSYLEEYLFLIKGRAIINVELLEKESGIGRFKNVIKSIDEAIVGSHLWLFFLNAQKVRNCLLHANGRIDMMKSFNDRVRLGNIIESSKGLLSIELSRIKLSSGYISKFSDNIRELRK